MHWLFLLILGVEFVVLATVITAYVSVRRADRSAAATTRSLPGASDTDDTTVLGGRRT
ncbi:hypothetical protein [Nocardia sp. MW-W600-9]